MEMVPTQSQGGSQKVSQGVVATQSEILNKGQEILNGMEGDGKSLFNKDWWYGQIMDWSMRNESFKTQMFRFVDVLPYLNSGSEVARHLKEYFAENGEKLPPVFSFGLGMGSLAPALLAGAVKKNVTQMAKMFITGENAKEALPILKKARSQGLTFTVDLLGEATLSESEAADYSKRYLELIEWLAQDATNWEPHSILDFDENGPIPKVNVSVKVTSLYSQVHETAWESTVEILKSRLRPIFNAAIANNVFINIDMEQFSHKNLTLDLFQQILMEPEYKSHPHFGIVIQAYLRDSADDIHALATFAKTRGTPFTVRLVKGAYWDYEVIHAKQKGWPIPVYTNKAESDVNYEACAKILLENYPHVRIAIGSHNVRSVAATLVMAENAGLPKSAVEIQMLYGMADQIKRSFVKQGYRVREYATVGELIPGMAYLVRRLLENTSNESWLKNKFADNISVESLLADPMLRIHEESKSILPKKPGVFYNEPPLDFAIESHRHQFLKSLNDVKKKMPYNVSAIIDGKEQKLKETFIRVNPSHPSMTVAQVASSTVTDCENAIQSAKKHFQTWSQTPPEARAKIIDQLANIIAENRFELCAIEVYEVGKTWQEADGDI
ncbi:MAG: proline dehydrogenase family protein, partial [Bdellovibrionales bacterium]|nr:proline dehydrogenase family protein [Bdellovibrionales bacterium]